MIFMKHILSLTDNFFMVCLQGKSDPVKFQSRGQRNFIIANVEPLHTWE